MRPTANHLAIMPALRSPADLEADRARHEAGFDRPQAQSTRELLAVMLTTPSDSLPFQVAMETIHARHKDALDERRKQVEGHDSWLRAVYSYLFGEHVQ